MDINGIKNLLNQAYDSFGASMRSGPLTSIQQNDAAMQNLAGQEFDRRNQALTDQNQQALGAFSQARMNANRNSDAAVHNIQQSIANAFGAFGQTPQSIGGPPVDYSQLQPALTQYANQSASQFGGQAAAYGRQVSLGEANQQLNNADALAALTNWRKLLELSSQNKYQQQRDAFDREILGSDLERHRTLANLEIQGAR